MSTDGQGNRPLELMSYGQFSQQKCNEEMEYAMTPGAIAYVRRSDKDMPKGSNVIAVCAGEVRPLERHRGKARASKINFHNAGCSAGAAPVGYLPNVPGARRRLSVR